MTQSFILMSLGIGIGYWITLWLQRSRRTSSPAFGAITDMQSIAHETVSSSGGKISTAVASGGIEELAKKAGAEIVMFVDRCGQLVVVDTDTGIPLREFDDSEHDLHSAQIRFSDEGEPVLYDMKLGKPEPIVEHKRLYEQYREPVANPKSGRNEAASVIYFWRFSGTSSCCTWSGGKHRVRNG
jgi:hypothetical protein